ncbi:MAG: HNH endonuclease [Planctomycetia bacterium]|nr:HNH endonuclease [Planctomycetia bacterium]
MSGIMMIADPDWISFQTRNARSDLAVFYASPHKKTQRQPLDPLFCVNPGQIPRDIVAVGRIRDQVEINHESAWDHYGRALGADTEEEWRKQASAVINNCRKTYEGRILAIELVDFRPFPIPVEPASVGLVDSGWSDKKNVSDGVTIRLLDLFDANQVSIDLASICASHSDLTIRQQLIDARIGQGKFRSDVLEMWENSCCVTDSAQLQAIRASHIKPWKHSTDVERLDPFNGLPLVATLDALFDRRLISFDGDGSMLISDSISSVERSKLGLNGLRLNRAIPEKTESYLQRHRQSLRRMSQ